MQTSTNKKQQEQLDTQLNVEEIHKQSYSLVERKLIPGTPFQIVQTEEGHFLTMGEYRITETCPTKEEALDKLETDQWLITMHMIAIVLEKSKEPKPTYKIQPESE